MFIRASIMLVAFLGFGCTTVIAPHSITETSRILEVSEQSAIQAWARVLESAVDIEGKINFKLVAKTPKDIYTYISYISQVSPTKYPSRFPTRAGKLAYYINSYNALAMYGVIQKSFPSGFEWFLERVNFFILTLFEVGGESISLYDYENDFIRPLGESRIHFVLNCMVKSCPRLPQQPVTAEALESQLESLSREFFNSEKHLRLDKQAKVVYMSEIMKFYTEDFVGPGRSSSLIEYANKFRNEPIKESYDIRFIPYDWTVNFQKD